MKPKIFIPVLFFAAVTAGAGCYTVLRHPVVSDLTEEAGGSKACSDCHADADLYHDVYTYDANWYHYYPAPWSAYYVAPWWYDDYWYYDTPGSGSGTPVENGSRHMWTRESGGGGPGLLPIQGDQQVGGSGRTTKPDKPETPPSGSDEDKDKKDKKRHLWGR